MTLFNGTVSVERGDLQRGMRHLASNSIECGSHVELVEIATELGLWMICHNEAQCELLDMAEAEASGRVRSADALFVSAGSVSRQRN